eukprot:UN01801
MYLVNNYSKDDRKYKPLAWAITFAARFIVFYIGDSFKRELFHVYATFGGLSLIGYYIGDRMTYDQSAFRTCMISILLFESITTMTMGIHGKCDEIFSNQRKSIIVDIFLNSYIFSIRSKI